MKSIPSEVNAHVNAGSRLLKAVISERTSVKQPDAAFQESQKRNWEGDEVRVQLHQFLPIILQAALDRSTWLDDFDNEILVISKDLHEVLSTFQRMRSNLRAA